MRGRTPPATLFRPIRASEALAREGAPRYLGSMVRTSPHPTPLSIGTTLAGGAPEGLDAKLIAELAARAGGPVIHVARDATRLAAVAEALAFFAPDIPVLRFPAWDCLPYDRISPNADISAARMAALAALTDGWPRRKDAPGKDNRGVILTTLAAALQATPSRDVVKGASFIAEVDKPLDLEALKDYLARMGYNRAR
jgi:transcription-repair coupling factor (superfamily II helicase)